MEGLQQRLRLCMARVGDVTATDVRRRTGLGYATIHGILSDDPAAPEPNPTIDTLRKLAGKYGVSVAWLLGDDGDEDPVEALVQAISHPVLDLLGREVPISEERKIQAAYRFAADSEFTPHQLADLNSRLGPRLAEALADHDARRT